MITVLPQILSTSQEQGKTRVIYSLVASDGQVFGPYCDDINGSAEDHANLRASGLEQSLNVPDAYQTMQYLFDTNIGPGTYDAVRSALKDLGGQYITLGDNLKLNVTYPNQINPEDVEASLRARVDAQMGEGTLDAVKSLLRAVGFNKTTIERKSEIIL